MQMAGATGQFKSPRDVGVAIAETARKALPHLFGERGMISDVEVGGPGFVNLYLSEAFVSARVQRLLEDGGLKPMHTDKCKVGCDFSSPNVAKEMHVGHLRSTILGDTICRVLEYCGCDVVRVMDRRRGGRPVEEGLLARWLLSCSQPASVHAPSSTGTGTGTSACLLHQ